jgi:uncharacterized protein with von Willebrand factor type A (vWA) domain
MGFIDDLLEKTRISTRRLAGQLQQTSMETDPAIARTGAYQYRNDGPRDTIVTQDVSGSVGTKDYPPTRLAGGIAATIEYTNARARHHPDDRIAVISFTDRAKILLSLTPITRKPDIIKVVSQLTSGGGTDIAAGLKAAIAVFDQEPVSDRQRHIILLTDGHGGRPVKTATTLKEQYHAVIDVVGIGGTPKAVKESLLRKVATTDPDGFNHYRFIKDAQTLKEHYRQLATGLVWHGGKNDQN